MTTRSLSLSNYHGLCQPDFDLPAYIQAIAEDARANETRVFCGLGNGDVSDILLYRRVNSKLRLGDINPSFVNKLDATARACKKYDVRLVLCTHTDPKYSQTCLEWQLGYRDAKDLMLRGDFPNKQFPNRWANFLRFQKDLAAVVKELDNPAMVAYVEFGNEQPEWGSIIDEQAGCTQAWKDTPRKKQLNPPSITELDDVKWFQRLASSTIKGFRVSRFSFHGYKSPSEIQADAKLIGQAGVSMDKIQFSTDGGGLPYAQRKTWRKQKAAVIENHQLIVAKCHALKSYVDIQDVLKYDGKFDMDQKDNVDFRKALADL